MSWIFFEIKRQPSPFAELSAYLSVKKFTCSLWNDETIEKYSTLKLKFEHFVINKNKVKNFFRMLVNGKPIIFWKLHKSRMRQGRKWSHSQ